MLNRQTKSLLMELPCHIEKRVNNSTHKTINFKRGHEKGQAALDRYQKESLYGGGKPNQEPNDEKDADTS